MADFSRVSSVHEDYKKTIIKLKKEIFMRLLLALLPLISFLSNELLYDIPKQGGGWG